MENSTSIAYKKENTTFKNELTSNQILDFASMLQLVLGCSIIMLNLFSTLILIRSTKMMFSVRLPAINMSISYILLGIGLLVPDTLVFDRHVCLLKELYCSSTVICVQTNHNNDECRSCFFTSISIQVFQSDESKKRTYRVPNVLAYWLFFLYS